MELDRATFKASFLFPYIVRSEGYTFSWKADKVNKYFLEIYENLGPKN